MKIITLIFIILTINIRIVHADEIAKYYSAPTTLPNVTTEMKTPGFWIGRHPAPDDIILSRKKIENLNLYIQDQLKSTTDIINFPSEVSNSEAYDFLNRKNIGFSTDKLFDNNGRIVEANLKRLIIDNANLKTLPAKIKTQFGFIIHNADQRILPSDKSFFLRPGDVDFDELQENALDIGMPVVILHNSLDGKWYLVLGPSSMGWIKADNIALCEKSDFKTLYQERRFIIVVRSKADIYLDENLTKFYGFIRMGTRFFVKNSDSTKTVNIFLPTRNDKGWLELVPGYISRSMINDDYLDMTARNIYLQAFEMLNTPYGWGGINGEQDCSQFIQEIFSTMGINLPRNSADQAKVGKLLIHFDGSDKNDKKLNFILNDTSPANSILYMKGHIILFLGVVNSIPYAIHDTWAYREPAGRGEDVIRLINRVAVTDLSIGEGSAKGSLLDRILSIQILNDHYEN
ncbi:MAG: SH3 domain-containing protein [Candidatus Omnitrophica bacterium]|nr:SH3 domain-containing protein [Candidatus Omnitrophota bacterium]